MRIEEDKVRIVSGVRRGKTIGSPIGIEIHNRDWENWQEVMSISDCPLQRRPVKSPRPPAGHADLAGMLKY